MAEKSGIRVLVVGGGAREHSMVEAAAKNPEATILNFSSTLNPGISRIAGSNLELGDECDGKEVSKWAKNNGVDLAVIGPEGPLNGHVTDYLLDRNIKVASPTYSAAQVELSKVYLRDLMRDENIPGQVGFEYFTDADRAEKYLRAKKRSKQQFVLKPDGLTRGMGVKVMGSHLPDTDAAISYAKEVLDQKIWGKGGMLIEEKVEGQEWTLQALVSGEDAVPLEPAFRDFKYSEEGDTGSFCGSMGGYSRKDGRLSYVTDRDIRRGLGTLTLIARALVKRNRPFYGKMYGQFMKKEDQESALTEVNARGGEPDIIPALKMMRSDYVHVLRSVVNGALARFLLSFDLEDSVIRYVVPSGYPDNPREGSVITIDEDAIRSFGVDLLFARVKPIEGGYLTTTSRSLALYAQGPKAGLKIDQGMKYIKGDIRSRSDIGNGLLI